MQFLMGLDDYYKQIRSFILSRETLPDVRSAYATISSEESHRVAVGSIDGFSQRNQASAFVSNVPYSQNFQRNNQNFNTGPSRPNNVNNNRQGGGSGLNNNRPSRGSGLKKFDQNFKKQSVSNNNYVGKSLSYGFIDEQMATLISLIKDNKVEENVQANMTGANHHMSYTDKELDNVIDISHLKIKVSHPNRTKAYISKIENLRLSNGLTLYDVMVIPEYYVTLISVHKLIKENKVIVVFEENRCYFMNQDLNLKNVLRINEQCEGLYYYNDKGPVLNVLKDSLNFDKKDNTSYCEICQRTKQTRELFLLSDHKSKNLGDLLHLDLWSLIRLANDLNKGKSDGSSSSESSSNINTADFPVDSGNDVDSKVVVYMKPQEGYFPSDNKVCRLKKSLYGLKQAPRQWNGKLTSTLIENGFSQSKFDYSLYTESDKVVFLALLVYVDDIIITGNSVYEIEKFKVFLKSKFMIKDLGKLKYFLGIEVVDTDKGICLNQRKYVLDLLSEYYMLACKPAKTPLMSKLVISNEASDKDSLLKIVTDYHKLMGKLIYLTNTRTYISYVVHCLSQFMHSSLTSHLKAKCIVTRKSVTAIVCFLIILLFLGKSRNKIVSKSSIEAEYRALASVTSEIAANLVFHERTKHLEIDLHFVREKVLKRVVKTVKVDSTNQIADILTKGLDTVQHLNFVKKLECDGTGKPNIELQVAYFQSSVLVYFNSLLRFGPLDLLKETFETLPDVRSAYATISSEESHRVVRNNQSFNVRPSRPNNVNTNRQGGGSGLNNNMPGVGSGLVCENCGFNGHTIDRCFMIIGYPADFGKKKFGQNFKKQSVFNNNYVGKSSFSGFTDEQMATLISLIKDNKVGKSVQANMTVDHPNGTEAYISKIGNLILSNGLTLYDVMVIPEYCVTLISVHKLIKENKVIVAFDESRFYFLNQDLNLKNILGIGEQCEGLYYYSDKGPVLNVLKDSLNFDKKDNTGYSNFKKGYRLYSLDKHRFIFSRDVKFFENIFPFKDSEVRKNDSTNVLQDVNHINFFDIEYPDIPNDDERVANDLNKGKSDSSISSESGSNINTADFPVDSGNDTDSSNDFVATQNEELATLEENNFSEGNLEQNPSSSQGVQNVRRSSRQSVFPNNYNDFVVESKVKYGLERYDFSTWMAFGGNTHDSCSFGEETNKILDLHQISWRFMHTVAGDGITGIKRCRRDLNSDGVRNFATASRRGQLKENLESSTRRRRQDF
nr:ribonuclease H-like domain-containing protein [Tanacetum cinerariifolium]